MLRVVFMISMTVLFLVQPVFAESFDFTKIISSLKPLDKGLGEPNSQDWLANHPEQGQTFSEYITDNDLKKHVKEKVIYVQPIGRFTKNERRILAATAEFLGLYYGLNCKIKADLSETLVPFESTRINPEFRVKQFLAQDIIDKLLVARVPNDAAAYIGLTAVDLWPGEGWNFVFGMATPDEKTGVWSLYRYGNPDIDRKSFLKVLTRMIKVAAHETGHMFSFMHCINAKCLLNGSNHLLETDATPITLCSQCFPKLLWLNEDINAVQYYEKLIQWSKKYNLEEFENAFVKRIEIVQ